MIAFVFPGQGSQSVGMLAGLAAHDAARRTLAEADAALGEPLSSLIADGPAEALNLTVNTQPAMLTAAVATLRVWLAEGGRAPDLVAGHSLGEYSALVAAGVLDFGDALRAVRLRAQAMQQAVPVGVGAMAAALRIDAEAVVDICARLSRPDAVVEAVNFNEPKQTVISGHKEAVDAAAEAVKAAGGRALPLPVSAPFHSSLMRPAAEALRAHLQGVAFAAPRIPLVNNVDVAVVTEPDALRDALVRQACGPVRWVECVRALAARGATRFVECGPGKALAGMIKRIDEAAQVDNLSDLASVAALKEKLA